LNLTISFSFIPFSFYCISKVGKLLGKYRKKKPKKKKKSKLIHFTTFSIGNWLEKRGKVN